MNHAHRNIDKRTTTFGKRTKKFVIAGIAAALVLGGGGAAIAYWTSQGTGTGTATAGDNVTWTIATDAPAGAALFPGGPEQTVDFTVTNPGTGAQTLTSVVVSVANADGSTWITTPGCAAADYTVGVPTIVYGEIEPDGELSGQVTVTMNNTGTNQDACQGVTVPLYFVAS